MKSKIPKHKKGAWFVGVRGSYLPVSWQGWLMYIPYVLLIFLGFYTAMSQVFMCMKYGCGTISTVQTAAYGIVTLVPYIVALVVVMQWIAKRKS